MNIFQRFLRFLSGKSPLDLATLQADYAIWCAAMPASHRCSLRIESMDSKNPRTLYGVGARFGGRGLDPVFIASHGGYSIATRLLNHETRDAFLRNVAARTITESGGKWKAGQWTWKELSASQGVPAHFGTAQGCLPDAALFVRNNPGYDLYHSNGHAFAMKEDHINHSIWVWPGAGFAPREVLTTSAKEAAQRVFARDVRALEHLILPKL